MSKELIAYLSAFVSENRRKKFDEVIRYRTRHITIALEDIYQPHNASAVLRSCDCFGIQDVHIIENRNAYTVNPDVALGSFKWLSLYKYNQEESNTASCIRHLKQKGYRIIATTPHTDNSIDDLDISAPLCLFFGTELEGITDEVRQAADGLVKIPMFGFTESFNISVSAALCLHTLVSKLHRSPIAWQLSESEQEAILLEWLRNSIAKPELIEKEFYQRKKA
ncbi:MAG: RNA methyltransferase [Bacteroidota bacterium]